MTRVTPPPVLAHREWIGATSLRSSRALQSVVLALGLVVLRFTDPDRPLPIDLCAFKSFTGVPCPTCGLTRAVCHALRGDWAISVGYHPAGILVAAGLLAWMLWSVAEALRGRSIGIGVRDRVSTSFVTVSAVLSVVSWVARLALGETRGF